MAHPSQTNIFAEHPTFKLDIEEFHPPVCKYVEFKDIPVYAPLKQFSLLLFNIRSCRKNFNEFESIFYDYFKNFDCIVLTETWLTHDFDNLFFIHGFRSFNVYRTPNGGGIRLYCKKDLTFTVHVFSFNLKRPNINAIYVKIHCLKLSIYILNLDHTYVFQKS